MGSACAPYAITTPDGFVSLDQPGWSVYDYRATTPHGVVIAARQIRQRAGSDVPPASLDFWAEATRLRLRTSAGYALLEEQPFETADGTTGLRMTFGRDQAQTPYRYDVVLVVTPKFVHVLEAGGERELFDAASDDIDRALESYVVRR